MEPRPLTQEPFQRALEFTAHQARAVIERYPGYTPMYTVEGRWNREGERWTNWCEGFFPGILWLLHQQTNDPYWEEQAVHYTAPLVGRRYDRAVHDLGFLFMSTYLRWYRRTGDSALKQVLVDAGRTLALRRQRGGYLASFVGPQSLFIDIMMNVRLIFWVAEQTCDEALRTVALEHCRTTQRHLVRPDGGTAHEGIFDVGSGQFLREGTHQGWRPGSTWSRGLAWAIYGFTSAARYSREPDFLDTAQRCADYYLMRAPEGLVPYWDFDLPENVPHLWDSSAAAVTASGLWNLSEDTSDPDRKERYRTGALTILSTLCTERFLASSHPGWEGILLHGVYHYHKGLGVDESVAWGDHFFVEALVKALSGNSGGDW